MPRWLSRLLKFTLTLGVLTAIAGAVDPSALLASLQVAQWKWVVIAGLLLPLNLALDGWVWKTLLNTILDDVPLQSIAGALLSGLALGFWTPARVGEYAGRALFLPDGDRWAISLTVFAQRMVDMAVGVLVGLAALVGAFAYGLLPASTPWVAAAAIGGGTGAALLGFVAAPGLAHRLATALLPHWPSVTERTVLFQRLSRRQVAAVVAGSLARYGVFVGQFVCLGVAFAPQASGSLLWMAGSLTFYAKYLLPSLTLLDLGIREGGAAFFFGVLGLGAAAGVNAALLLFAINILLPALLGMPLVATLRVSDDAEPAESFLPAPLSGS